MNGTARLVVAAVGRGAIVLCLGLLCSCSTNRTRTEPWLKDNQKIGVIETSPQPWGSESRYKDLSSRVLRIEEHDPDGRLLAGPCITTFSYAQGDALAEEQHLNSSGQLILIEDGYAVRRWTRSLDSDQNWPVVEESLFDVNLRPVSTHAGFAILRRTEDANGRTKKIVFLDPARKAAPSTWLGVASVVEVQYEYLQGVTEVTCAAFLDGSGNVIAQKQLSGLTSSRWSSSSTTYHHY